MLTIHYPVYALNTHNDDTFLHLPRGRTRYGTSFRNGTSYCIVECAANLVYKNNGCQGRSYHIQDTED